MNALPKICLLNLVAICALGAQQTHAQNSSNAADSDPIHGPDHEHDELEEIIVTATPLGRDVVELSQSATVLSGDALAREATSTLGETLARLPGLSNASFGENVGRPVIRGLQGNRVGVLNDGMNSFDASSVSQDHAVPTEPFIADQIEVLRGPTTLLYGSGAIGGVVNVVTKTIPEELPEDGLSGRVMLQGDTAADQRMGAARLDLGAGNLAFHANGFVRRSDDYEIPGMAELENDGDHEDHEEEEEVTGLLENSFLDNEGGAIGGAWIGDSWRVGLSWTDYESDYGIPGGHAHEHEEDDDDHGDEAHEEEGEEEEIVTIALKSSRLDAVLHGRDPFPGFTELDLKIADTNYTHTEFEGDEIGTVFDSDSLDLRAELTHSPWGAFSGTLGAQWSDNDFSAIGEEAFVPPSTTDTVGLFWVESAAFGDWQFDFGLRWEDTTVDSVLISHEHDEDHGEEDHDEEHEEGAPEAARRSFSPFSASLGAIWHVNERSHLAFNISRAERAPSAAELFSNGPHIATQTFELGDPDLSKESNTHYEASWRLHEGQLTGSVTVYVDDFDGFIYQANTGEEEDGFPVRVWSQQDAKFTGGEIELRWDLGRNATGHWQLFGFYDRVRAELNDGSNVPRIPPQRIGLGMDWDRGPWAGNLTWINADAHNRTADFETPTPGYDLLNADLSFYLPISDAFDLEFFLQGRNLLDEDIRNSTSFLKDQAPQIGRNFVFGVRSTF